MEITVIVAFSKLTNEIEVAIEDSDETTLDEIDSVEFLLVVLERDFVNINLATQLADYFLDQVVWNREAPFGYSEKLFIFVLLIDIDLVF